MPKIIVELRLTPHVQWIYVLSEFSIYSMHSLKYFLIFSENKSSILIIFWLIFLPSGIFGGSLNTESMFCICSVLKYSYSYKPSMPPK